MQDYIPAPKFSLGEKVVYSLPDIVSNCPHSSIRTVTGLMFDPQIEDIFEAPVPSWYYVLAFQDDEMPDQEIVIESDLRPFVSHDRVVDVLGESAEALERIIASTEIWFKQDEAQELVARIEMLQKPIIRLLDELNPKKLNQN